MSLPNGYTEVEYIESTGAQYIDTGFKPNQNTRVVMDAQISQFSGYAPLFGARVASKSSEYASWAIDEYLFQDGYGSSMYGSLSGAPLVRNTIDKNKNVFSVSGVTLFTHAIAMFQSAYTMYLFNINTSGSTTGTYKTYARLYGCQIYDNDVLVRDFVPAVRADGTVGLLDKQNDVFYTNYGSVAFIAGQVVEPEPEEPDKPTEPEKPTEPIVPNGLECFGATMKAAILGWGASNGAQTYKLRRDGEVVYQGEDICYTDAGLEPGRVYAYTVSSVFEGVESEEVPLDVETKTEMWLIDDRTVRDLVTRERRAFYNALDLIRVGEAMTYLERHFYDVGISTFVSPKLNWSLLDVPTQAQAEKYLRDVKAVRSKVSEFRGTSTLPDSMAGFDWDAANRIEKILFDAERLIMDIIKSYRLICGRTISGVNCLP